ncbi:MAG: F-type H+-transporting ATPase subunit a [Patescibacteria group bacterium]|nr:F-type H+-transporting ATPase subunit a [Patescibacteria group bacterium]
MENAKHFLQLKEEIPSIYPHELFSVGPLTFSSSSMMSVLAVLVFLTLAYFVSKFKLIPNSFQIVVEDIVNFVHNFIIQIVGDRQKANRILPYVGSVFLFILFSNLIVIIPGITSFTWHGEPLFTGSTADFNTTFALALASVVIININSMIENGAFSHLSHFIQIKPIFIGFKKSIGEGFLAIINFFVGLIEIIGEFAKIISLSLRLFGNMFAHEVLTVILLGAFSIFVPAVWMGMGILVGVVQAVVFTALITVYYSLTIRNETHH